MMVNEETTEIQSFRTPGPRGLVSGRGHTFGDGSNKVLMMCLLIPIVKKHFILQLSSAIVDFYSMMGLLI